MPEEPKIADVAVEEKPLVVKKSKKGSVSSAILGWMVVFIVIGAGMYFMFYYEGPYPWEKTESIVLEPANVELYRFSALEGWNNETNETLNVEIWLKNTGEEISSGLSVFVRARNQDGTVLYMGLLDLTWEFLGEDDTCSATYEVDYELGDTYIETTIEIRWYQEMNSYLKKTELT